MSTIFFSLRARLVLLILTAVVPAFGLTLYSAVKHRRLTASQVQQNALIAARVIASEQDRVLENAHQFLVTLARVPQIREHDKIGCRKILAGVLEPRYADLVVADLNGNPLCTALPPGRSLASSEGRHHSRAVETSDFSVGNLRHDPFSGKLLLDVSYPVMDHPGIVRAVVSAALDLSWIYSVTVDNHLYSGATFTLLSSKGSVLLRYPTGMEWIGKPIISEAGEPSSASRDTEHTVEAIGADGVHRLFAFSRLKTPFGGQFVYAAIDLPAELAFAETRKVLMENLFALAILSGVILICAWFGTDVFVLRRIRDIITATHKVARGDLSARTTLPYNRNELGQMARAFDHLANALERREAEGVASAKQIQQQRQQQETLYELNRSITSTLDVAGVLQSLLQHISALFPGHAFAISWFHTDTRRLEPIAHRGFDDGDGPNAGIPSTQSLPLLVFQKRSPVAISDARAAELECLGDPRWTSYLGLPLVAKGEALGVLSFYGREKREFGAEEIDFLNALLNEAAIAIYNSRLFEQTRKQAVELEKSNKIKDEFLGVMSHELRTPLNIIMNYSEALRMGTFGEMGPDQARGTEKICSQAGHLLSLINGILEITKIESGTVSVENKPVDLKEFMAEIKSDYMLPIEKDIALVWNDAADLPVITSDRIKLKQILTNLINNAIKFTDHGSVTVTAEVSPGSKTVDIHVADTGAGIPTEHQSSVFDKFRQIDSATTRNYSGAGLGLYIVKNFVDLLGGTIDVRSSLGTGSVFTVRLPNRCDNGQSQVPPPPPKPAEAYTL